MEEAMEQVGGDGFMFNGPLSRRYVADVTDGLVPALQKRGLVRTAYAHAHFRDNLNSRSRLIASPLYVALGAMTVQQTFATLGRSTVPLIAAAIVVDLGIEAALVGVYLAIGSVAVNRLLKGQVSAKYSPASVVVMGGFVLCFYWVCRNWEQDPAGVMYGVRGLLAHADVIPLLASLLGIAISG
eukprot:gene13097-16702_t